MNRNAVKVVSFVLCAMTLLSLAACSPSSSGSFSSSSGSQSSAAADPFGKYSSTLTLSTVRTVDSFVKFDPSNPERKSLTQNIWADAYKDKLNVQFNYLWTTNDDQYDSKWNTAIASGDIPDCAVVDSTIYKELLDAGYVEDMTDYYNNYASGQYKQWSKEDGGVTEKYMTVDGKLYGLPEFGSQPDNNNILCIRNDWLKKVNMPEPKTFDDLIAVAKAFKAAKLGGDGTYGFCINKQVDSMLSLLNAMGAYYNIWIKDGSSGKLTYSTVQPAMRDALLKLQSMYQDGLFNQDFAVKDSTTAGEDIAAGKVGITGGIYITPLLSVNDNIIADKNADWKVILPPTADGSEYKSQGSATPDRYIFVKKGCKNPEAVVKVVNLDMKLKTEQYTKYNLCPDNVQVFTYCFAVNITEPWKNLMAQQAVAKALTTKDASMLSPEQKTYYDMCVAAINGSRKDIGYNLVFGADSAFKYVSELKDSNRIIVDQDQTLPTDTQVASGETLRTSLDAAMEKVIMGDDISTWDEAVTAWKKGGGDKITDEVNEWYAKQ